MSRRLSSRTSGSVGTSRGGLQRTSSLPSPFSPSTASPLRVHEPHSHLRLTSLEKSQLIELAHYVASELVSFSYLINTSKLKKRNSNGVLHSKTTILSQYESIENYKSHVHPFAFNGFNATSTLFAIPTSHDDAMISVKWSIAKGTWTHDRDFCYLEIQKPFVAPSGRRGYVRCIHSIPLFISSSKTRCIRASLVHSGVVVMETQKPGRLQETVIMNIDPKGRMPIWVASFMVRRILLRTQTQPYFISNEVSKSFQGRSSLHDRSSTVRRQNGTMQVSLSGLNYPRASIREIESLCKVCLTRMKWYRSTVKCKVCQAAVCKPCSTHCDALLKATDRACLRCNEQLARLLAKSDVPPDQPEETFIFVDDWDE